MDMSRSVFQAHEGSCLETIIITTEIIFLATKVRVILKIKGNSEV